MNDHTMIVTPITQQWGSALKLIYNVTWRGGTHNFICVEAVVNNLAKIRFRWVTSSEPEKNTLNPPLDCSFSSKRLDNNKLKDGTVIKIDVRSDTLKYSNLEFCPPDCWSDWQPIAKNSGNCIKNTTINCAIFDFYISAYKIAMDTLSSNLYADTDFTDFQLCTDEGSVAVHKACLATLSNVFKVMLSGEWQEVKEGKINIKGVTPGTLQHLKDYLYLGVLPDQGLQLRPLLLVAKCYLVEDLAEHCIRKLAQAATGKDLYSLHEFACENNIPELTFATLQLTRNVVVTAADRLRQTENDA